VTCVVKWFENDRAALVFPEIHKSLAKTLPEGKEVEAVLYTDSGIYAFDSIVINSPLEHDFVIEIPDEKKRIQRRDYVRAPFNLKFVLTKEEMEIETKTINIGGGGVRFLVKDELKANAVWKFVLYMPDGTIAKGTGIILYSLLQGKMIVSVLKFTDISETDRNRIIKKCFEEEVKNLKLKKLTGEEI
jgi:c-di-GMP-binding flagellar brake protein YcgR